ncbi:MAG: RdgB/HAM1 family non-canonical purine NTP pyrophosphatase [Burkholderiaceae bacterium]
MGPWAQDGSLPRWVLASANAGKLEEMRRLLSVLRIDLVAQSTLGVLPCEEPFETFLENALQKARHASRCTGMPAIADDSGLVVDALQGAPGVRSARFFGDAQASGAAEDAFGAGLSVDAQNWHWLLQRMAGVSDAFRTARFMAVVCFVREPQDPTPICGVGFWNGRIATAPAGAGGFGYDCIFFDPSCAQTAAEMSSVEKDARGHRGMAMRAFLDSYRQAYGD